MSRTRRRFTSEQKAQIVRRHLAGSDKERQHAQRLKDSLSPK